MTKSVSVERICAEQPMSSESPESAYRPPAEGNASNPTTPGVLGIFGAVVISVLAGVGACCGTCFSGLIFIGSEADLGVAMLIYGAVGLGTFVAVLAMLSRTIDRANKTTGDDRIPPPVSVNAETDNDDTERKS